MDSTHFKMANSINADNLNIGTTHHVGQHKGESYYKDLVGWLHGKITSKQIFGKKYEGEG